MAKTKGKNKSQSIREYLTANPDTKAKAVVAGDRPLIPLRAVQLSVTSHSTQ